VHNHIKNKSTKKKSDYFNQARKQGVRTPAIVPQRIVKIVLCY